MKKRSISLLMLGVMLVSLVFLKNTVKAEDMSGKTVILSSNDVHGAVDGYEKMAALKEEFTKKGADVIVVDAGDYSQGDTYVSQSKGEAAIRLMNAVGYDFATLGNHEFDYGADKLISNLAKATFTPLVSDILGADGNTLFSNGEIIEKGGVKIGFFGMATPETQTKSNPALIKDVTFLSNNTSKTPTKAAQEAVDALKAKGADLVICLSHYGVDSESDPYLSTNLYKEVSGIDFMLDGHSHTVMESGDSGEPISSTGTKFNNIGVLVIDNVTKKIESNYNKPVSEIADSDADIATLAAEIKKEVDDELGMVFAKSRVNLNGSKSKTDDLPNGNRDGETNNGDLITDAMKWYASKEAGSVKVDSADMVAITNGGGIRAEINKGDITKKDIKTVLPFGNTVTVVYLKGSELLEALEASTYCTPEAVGGFPQVSGIDYTIDTTKEYKANSETYPGSTYYGPSEINRVTINSINGKEFDPTKTYAVITNDFCASGGDTYYAFAASNDKFDTGYTLDEAVMDYITEELGGEIGTTYENPQGRIHIHTSECSGSHIENNKSATCIETGMTGDEICDTCGMILTKSEEIGLVEHQYVDGTCQVCGQKLDEETSNEKIININNVTKTSDSSFILLISLMILVSISGIILKKI